LEWEGRPCNASSRPCQRQPQAPRPHVLPLVSSRGELRCGLSARIHLPLLRTLNPERECCVCLFRKRGPAQIYPERGFPLTVGKVLMARFDPGSWNWARSPRPSSEQVLELPWLSGLFVIDREPRQRAAQAASMAMRLAVTLEAYASGTRSMAAMPSFPDAQLRHGGLGSRP
jgi:hypothetical protein